MGIVHLPLQYFQLPLDSRANLRLRRHRAYSGPVYRNSSKGTPGRRDDVSWSIVFAGRTCNGLWMLEEAITMGTIAQRKTRGTSKVPTNLT
jgi:hypothetical protein